ETRSTEHLLRKGSQPFPGIRGDSRSYVAIRNLLRVDQNGGSRPVLVWQKRYINNRAERDRQRNEANGPSPACKQPEVFADLLRQVRFFDVIRPGRSGNRALFLHPDRDTSPCAADRGLGATSAMKTRIFFGGQTVR